MLSGGLFFWEWKFEGQCWEAGGFWMGVRGWLKETKNDGIQSILRGEQQDRQLTLWIYRWLPAPSVSRGSSRGLSFNCTDIDILKFFAGLTIVDVLLVNKSGRFLGEAFVVFAGAMQVEFVLQRDRQNMGRRYVEVFRSKKQDYYNAVAAEINYEGIYDNNYHCSSPPPSRSKRFSDKDQMECTEILKMPGLPFQVTKSRIVEFFKVFELVEDRVHIACCPDGKATGESGVIK
ncbi:RNA-binding protein 12 [Spatholobus suberectus]|nr:RNA-binding protein 12 [Spatholobus suberectus]